MKGLERLNFQEPPGQMSCEINSVSWKPFGGTGLVFTVKYVRRGLKQGTNYLFFFVFRQIMNALWWYYFSKLIEFMDTIFFVLRKNNHQISFLHIYHHASMLNIWWFVVNWIPCGHSESFRSCWSIYFVYAHVHPECHSLIVITRC